MKIYSPMWAVAIMALVIVLQEVTIFSNLAASVLLNVFVCFY